MDTLAFEKIVQETRANKNFPQKYLQDLYNYNMEFTCPVKSSGPLTSIKCFYPLPTRLLLTESYTGNNKIVKNKNEYQFHGTSGNRIIFSDKKLPFVCDKLKYPIPFSFPVPSDSDIDIITSNVYYYEVTILNKQNMTPWIGECVSIGFGHKNTSFYSHVGWSSESVGFHSDDGTIRYNETGQVSKVHSGVWQPNDVAGAGIIYVGKNAIKPFFTINGKLIYMMGKTIEMKFPYFPMIGYDHSHSIEINFSTKPFVYDIKKLILKNSDNVISTDNSFICDYDVGNILNEPPIIESKQKFLFYNMGNNEMVEPAILSSLSELSNAIIDVGQIPWSPLHLPHNIPFIGTSHPNLNLNISGNININDNQPNPFNNQNSSINNNEPNDLSIPISNLHFMNLTGSIVTPNNLAQQVNPTQNNNIYIDNLSQHVEQNNESTNESNSNLWNSLVFQGQNLFNFININSSPINSLSSLVQVNENNLDQDDNSNNNKS